jgi:hypothetical protein
VRVRGLREAASVHRTAAQALNPCRCNIEGVCWQHTRPWHLLGSLSTLPLITSRSSNLSVSSSRGFWAIPTPLAWQGREGSPPLPTQASPTGPVGSHCLLGARRTNDKCPTSFVDSQQLTGCVAPHARLSKAVGPRHLGKELVLCHPPHHTELSRVGRDGDAILGPVYTRRERESVCVCMCVRGDGDRGQFVASGVQRAMIRCLKMPGCSPRLPTQPHPQVSHPYLAVEMMPHVELRRILGTT